MEILQRDIATVSKVHLDNTQLGSSAEGLEAGIKSLNPLDSTQYFVLIGILFMIVMVMLLFPCLFRLLLKSIHSMKRDLPELPLKNKKTELPHQLQYRLCDMTVVIKADGRYMPLS